jgi:hypothetical protein
MTIAAQRGMDVLPGGFKAFDFFDRANGEAISFKSANLVDSYANGRGLLSQLNKYIRAADRYTEPFSSSGLPTYAPARIDAWLLLM